MGLWIVAVLALAAVFAVGLALGRRGRSDAPPAGFTHLTPLSGDPWSTAAPSMPGGLAGMGSQIVAADDVDPAQQAILDAVRATGSGQINLSELAAATGMDEQRLRAHLLALDGKTIVEQTVETRSVQL